MPAPRPKAPPAATADCPCGSGASLATCCGRHHAGLRATPPTHAPTPEALMRARYSAYALGDTAYILATWHPSTAPGELEPQAIKWLGLSVKDSLQQGDAGVVEFIARYRDRLSGRAGRLHEISRFVQVGAGAQARWFYVDGVQGPAGEPEPAEPAS